MRPLQREWGAPFEAVPPESSASNKPYAVTPPERAADGARREGWGAQLKINPSRWQVFDTLYGKKAAALYTQAGDYQKTARFYYKKAEDTYYQANNWAAYDDWRRARDQWDYFYSRE